MSRDFSMVSFNISGWVLGVKAVFSAAGNYALRRVTYPNPYGIGLWKNANRIHSK